MPDMLVKLYDLPAIEALVAKQAEQGIRIRRGMPAEKARVGQWVDQHFKNEYWTNEVEIAFATQPTRIILAHKADQLLGFACYDISYKGFFGPTGVDEMARGQGIGTALLVMCLYEMRHAGYIYGIIGWAGPVEYYEKVVGATVIAGTESEPPPSSRGMLGTNR